MTNKYDFYDLEKVEELAGRPEVIEIDGYYWDPTDLPPKDYLDAQVPLQFKNIGKWMRSKMNGLQTRETMARLAEMVGINTHRAVDVAERTQIRQDAVEDFNTQVIQEMTDKDVISAPEIIQMRDGEATANDRLTRDFGELNQYRSLLESSFKFVDPTMSTEDIQDALIGGGKVVFLDGLYEFEVPDEYDPAILNVHNDTIIEFDLGVHIKLKEHSNIRYRIFNIENKQNVKIVGGLIDGSRELNSATSGEWGMGISVRGSRNVTIEDTKVIGCWGDGLYIGSTTTQAFSQNITLTRFKADNNRRQGISVISVKGLRGDDVELTNTNGTAPEFGIDFEPNYDYEVLEDIIFNNLRTANNAGNGIGFYLDKFTTKKHINMIFNNPSSTNDGGVGFGILRANFEADGAIVVNNLSVVKSYDRGIYHRSVSKKFARVIYNSPVLMDVNTSGLGGTLLGSPINIIRASTDYVSDDDFMLGNFEINNPQVIYTEHTPVTTSNIVVYDFVKETAGNNVHAEDVTLTGIMNGNIHRHTAISRARIDDTKLSTYSYWPGTSPVTMTLPVTNVRYKDYEFVSNKQQILVLSNFVADYNGPIKIRAPYDMGAYRVYIRPPENERLYPLKYSNGIGKGIYLNNVSGNGGSTVELERVGGKWIVRTLSGNWITEE